MTKLEFYQQLEQQHIFLSNHQKQQFDQYYHLLFQYNQIMDLTSVIEQEQVYERHFYDSLTIAFNKNFNGLKVCDVGSGAGFPAIPLKIVFPEMELTIIDSLTKRMNFLNEVVQQLDLKKVTIITARVEEMDASFRETFDIVMARAVARLNILLELCIPILKVNGIFIAMKGQKGQEELEEAQNAIQILNLKLNETQKLPFITNFYFLKQKKTSLQYPRRYSLIKKKPL